MSDERGKAKGKKGVRKLWLAIGILALLTPLGLIVPRWLGAGGAWGEWGLDEIAKMVGFEPAGMKRTAETWKAPMAGYTVPGQDRGLAGESLGYFLTGAIGIAFTAGAMYILSKALTRRKNGGSGGS